MVRRGLSAASARGVAAAKATDVAPRLARPAAYPDSHHSPAGSSPWVRRNSASAVSWGNGSAGSAAGADILAWVLLDCAAQARRARTWPERIGGHAVMPCGDLAERRRAV